MPRPARLAASRLPGALPSVSSLTTDEQALVQRVREGDAAAYESIFRAQYTALYHFAFRFLQSQDDADDAVQTVFVRIWNARTAWHVAGTLNDYLYLAVRNACRDRIQHETVVRRWREKRVGELRCELARGDGGAGGDGEETVSDAERDAMIRRAIHELPAKRRELFVLRFTEGLSYELIARRMGVARKTVETQISRALKQVRGAVRGPRAR